MADFGWSYPPGCSSVPGDEPIPPECETCRIWEKNGEVCPWEGHEEYCHRLSMVHVCANETLPREELMYDGSTVEYTSKERQQLFQFMEIAGNPSGFVGMVPKMNAYVDAMAKLLPTGRMKVIRVERGE